MGADKLKVFSKVLEEVTMEKIYQNIESFNKAMEGALVLTTEGYTGDYSIISKFKGIEEAQRHIDPYNKSATTETPLEQFEAKMVRTWGQIQPIVFDNATLQLIEADEARVLRLLSDQSAEMIIKDQLNTIIGAGVGAIGSVSGAVRDVSATDGISHRSLIQTDTLFGDARSNILVRVMDGVTYGSILEGNIQNASNLFNQGNVSVVDLLGKKIIVTDAPALFEAGETNKGKVLSLVGGGLSVDRAKIETDVSRTQSEMIKTSYMVDYSYFVGVKGFGYNEANGGKAPKGSDLADGANWEVTSSKVKGLAGVLTVFDADQ